jgi:predicted nucleic acid-binding protein
LDLLRKVVDEPLVIPKAVAEEVSGYPRGVDLHPEPWIRIQAVKEKQQVQLLLPTLDQGEAEVIALGIEQGARLLLLDELIGRKVAESLGLRITGSVGILIRAKQLGEISAVKPLLSQMLDTGFYLSRSFVEAVLRGVGE